MTIDVNVRYFDAAFFENLEDIMEDTMVQMFIAHPSDADTVAAAKEAAAEHGSVFYSLPLLLHAEADENCVAFSVRSDADRALLPHSGKPIFIDEALLDEATIRNLAGSRGVILDATGEHPALEGFLLAVGPGNVGAFDAETLSAMSMDRIVLQSGYPDHGFGEIYGAVKVISDAMFRPEQSIIARATKSSLELLGFR